MSDKEIVQPEQPKVADKMIRQLPPARFQMAEYARVPYLVTVEHGTAFAETLEPSFWAHVAAKLKAGDHIEVMAEDMSFGRELIVIETGRMWARVQEWPFTEPAQRVETPVMASEYTIKYAGPHHKHQVIRNSDNAVIKDQISQRTDAEMWLKNHIKSQAH
jgi:hypothetical protein